MPVLQLRDLLLQVRDGAASSPLRRWPPTYFNAISSSKVMVTRVAALLEKLPPFLPAGLAHRDGYGPLDAAFL